MKCKVCGKDTMKVMYGIFPMRLCSDSECANLYGFWGFVLFILPFNGVFLKYNTYGVALLGVVTGRLRVDEHDEFDDSDE